MKTKSIKSVAALLGLAVTLSASALAGPGPQSSTPTAKFGEPKKGPITIALAGTAPHSAKAAVTSEPVLTPVSGPHGVNYTFRR